MHRRRRGGLVVCDEGFGGGDIVAHELVEGLVPGGVGVTFSGVRDDVQPLVVVAVGSVAFDHGVEQRGDGRDGRPRAAALPPRQRHHVHEPEPELRRDVRARPPRRQHAALVRVPVQPPHPLQHARVLVRRPHRAERLDLLVAQVAHVAPPRRHPDPQRRPEAHAVRPVRQQRRRARRPERVRPAHLHRVEGRDEVVAVVRRDDAAVLAHGLVDEVDHVGDVGDGSVLV